MLQNFHSGHAGFGASQWNADKPGDNKELYWDQGLDHCHFTFKVTVNSNQHDKGIPGPMVN